MMNLGPEKGIILKQVFDKTQPKTILELGGYCGYSSLVFSHLTKATIHTIEISKQYAEIARKIQEFAGVADRNVISVGTVSSLKK
jgi:catechol O-methyltransferase